MLQVASRFVYYRHEEKNIIFLHLVAFVFEKKSVIKTMIVLKDAREWNSYKLDLLTWWEGFPIPKKPSSHTYIHTTDLVWHYLAVV